MPRRDSRSCRAGMEVGIHPSIHPPGLPGSAPGGTAVPRRGLEAAAGSSPAAPTLPGHHPGDSGRAGSVPGPLPPRGAAPGASVSVLRDQERPDDRNHRQRRRRHPEAAAGVVAGENGLRGFVEGIVCGKGRKREAGVSRWDGSDPGWIRRRGDARHAGIGIWQHSRGHEPATEPSPHPSFPQSAAATAGTRHGDTQVWLRPRGTPRVGEGTGSTGSCPFNGIRERCAPAPCARARGISRGWTRSGQGHPLPPARGSQEQPGAHGGAHGTPCGHSPGSARSDLSPDYGFLWIRRQEKQSLVLPGDAPSLHPPDPPVPPPNSRGSPIPG